MAWESIDETVIAQERLSPHFVAVIENPIGMTPEEIIAESMRVGKIVWVKAET